MTPDIVVDIGNSRMKWGRVADGKVVEMVSLSLEDVEEWNQQFKVWTIPANANWVFASVAPKRDQLFRKWLENHTRTIREITSLLLQDVTLSDGFKTFVENKSTIGVDRLLSAYAVKCLKPEKSPAVVICVGTAMTIDCLYPKGWHAGGSILPGPRLMAKSLQHNTSDLPLIDVMLPTEGVIFGRNTEYAIRVGIRQAIESSIAQIVGTWSVMHLEPVNMYITGGDLEYLRNLVLVANEAYPLGPIHFVPTLILEGIRLVSERMS